MLWCGFEWVGEKCSTTLEPGGGLVLLAIGSEGVSAGQRDCAPMRAGNLRQLVHGPDAWTGQRRARCRDAGARHLRCLLPLPAVSARRRSAAPAPAPTAVAHQHRHGARLIVGLDHALPSSARRQPDAGRIFALKHL